MTANGLPIAFQKIPFFLMGNAAIHRTVFEEIGRFDERLTHGGEEVDFSIRAALSGFEIGWVPEAVVYYRHRTDLRGLSKQFYEYGRATTLVYAQHREAAALPRTTIGEALRVFWDIAAHMFNLARGNRRRGEWIRVASFRAGQLIQSGAERTLHL